VRSMSAQVERFLQAWLSYAAIRLDSENVKDVTRI